MKQSSSSSQLFGVVWEKYEDLIFNYDTRYIFVRKTFWWINKGWKIDGKINKKDFSEY